MGAAKVIFLSGLYIVMGLYISSFKSAQQTLNSVSKSEAEKVQAERMARAGIFMALDSISIVTYGYNNYPVHIDKKNFIAFGDTILSVKSEDILPLIYDTGDQQRITCKSKYGNNIVTQIAVVRLTNYMSAWEYDGTNWYFILKYKVVSVYSKPPQERSRPL